MPGVGPALMQLSQLLTAAPQGDPIAKAALPYARDQFISPPPITSDMGGIADNMKIGRDQFSLPGGTPQLDSPEVKAGVQNTGSPAGPGTQISGGNTFTPEKQGFWSDYRNKDFLQGGIAGLIGMGVGKLTGLGGANVAAAAINPSLKDLYTRKQMDLEREGRAMEEAYKQAQTLPQAVATDARFQELYQAQQQLMQDIANGKTNPKSLSNFLTMKAKYSKELEDVDIENKINDEIKIKDRMDQALETRNQQKVLRLTQVLEDPMSSQLQKQQAQAELFMIQKEKMEYDQRQQQLAEQAKQHAETQKLQAEEIGLRRQGLTQDAAQHRETLAAQRAMQTERLGSQERVQGQRNQIAQMAQMNREVQNEIQLRLKAAQTNATQQGVPVDPAKIEEEVYGQKAGLRTLRPGWVEMFGKKLDLMQVFGPNNDLWGPDGFPSEKGKKYLIGMAKNALTSAGRQASELTLTGAYGQQE